MPNAASKNKNSKQIRQTMPVMGLNEFIITRKMNMVDDKTKPIIQANFLGGAPTYSGTWFFTINRPIIRVGENFGLMKTRMIKSVRNKVMTYFIKIKFCLKSISINDIKTNKNRIPADALISRSFNTGTL